MTKLSVPLTWELRCPPGVSAEARPIAAPWLAELSELRGRILFDEGRRPTFRLEDGSFADEDPLDRFAYHILARAPSGLVGCCRIIPFAAAHASVTESLLERQQFDHLLLELGTTRAQCCEGSRWMVVREYRLKALALHLVAGAWAVARWLGLEMIIGMVGTRDKQDRILMRTGGRPVPGLATRTCKIFDDELRALYFDVLHPAQPFSSQVDEMESLLGLKRGAGRLLASRAA